MIRVCPNIKNSKSTSLRTSYSQYPYIAYYGRKLCQNRRFACQAFYRCTCGYDNFDGSNYAVALWVYFLRPHKFNSYRVLNKVDMLESTDTMPGKGQLLIYLGQKTIFNIQSQQADA